MQYVPLIGRILYALIFVFFGIGHFTNLNQMSQYAGAMGVPAPTLAVIVTGLMILLGGLSVLLGYKVKIGSLLLFVFLVFTAFIMHAFWGLDDPMQAQAQMAHFLKNLSLAGAALLLFYFGTGPMSLEKSSEN
ncbi:MAG: DoxX family protein [Calditrichaeota bacterium]|nr:DoxX family protein [Calditrichota bacterium]